MRKEPSEQKDTKTILETLEVRLMGQVRHDANRAIEAMDRNDLAEALIRQQAVKANIKTLNWLKNKGYTITWGGLGPSEYMSLVKNGQFDDNLISQMTKESVNQKEEA